MQLIHHTGTNAFFGDVFSTLPESSDEDGGTSFGVLHGLSEIESEFEASTVQIDISKETIQWVNAEILLPKKAPAFQTVVSAWNSLASYRELRIP